MYDDWRGRLYPEREPKRRWLELYARAFDTVEVNTTFYRLARESRVAGWVRQTPPEFLFSVKASRYLTHIKRLRGIEEGIKRFYEPLAPLIEAGRLGPVLWQLPENFHRDDERLDHALSHLPPGHHAFEFRHPSWFADDVLAVLRQHRVALVIGDRPERPFQTHDLTSDFTIIRFHYGHRGRRGNYSETELQEWAARIERLRAKAAVFAYFNNDWEVFAPRNAARLQQLLQPQERLIERR